MTIKRRKNKNQNEYERLVAQEALILAATEEICRVLNASGISRNELAARLGKSKGFVSQVLSGERNMTLRTLADFATVLDHRLRIEATPINDQRIGPLYFQLGTIVQRRLRTLDSEFNQMHMGLAREWMQTHRKQPGAVRAAATKPERWSPATQGFECPEVQTEATPDHEFELTA